MIYSKKFWQELQKKVPILCVDGVVVDSKKRVLLTKRSILPFKGYWHLPGGVVFFKEKTEKAVIRIIKKETGLNTKIICLIDVYSDPKRDPRGHFVTIAYLLKLVKGKLKSDFQSEKIKFFFKLPGKIGFDAGKIAKDGLNCLKNCSCSSVD